MKKKFLYIIFALLCLNSIQAQRAAPDEINFKKYWWYHYRLVNDFLVKGDCKGCSEPANERDYQTVDATGIHTRTMKWGDQTISLGMYIGVLATEYRLLKNNGQPVDTTVEELYYALKAFNRLDEDAEEFYSSPGTHPHSPYDLNGFFMRDDVNGNFLEDHPQIKNGKIATREVEFVDSDYGADDLRTNEMSHDQVWHMFMGLALVSSLVDHGENYHGMPLNDLTGNYDINREAKDIADRIMNCIRSHNWIIKNPVTGQNVLRGPYVYELSYGAAEAGCFIENENVNEEPGYPVHTCNEYHDLISLGDAYLWNELGKPHGGVYVTTDEDYKVQVLAAIGKSWWTAMYPLIPNPMAFLAGMFNYYNITHPFEFISNVIAGLSGMSFLPQNVTGLELGIRAGIRDWQHLPLLLQVLHGGGSTVSSSTYYDILDHAPCNGPYNFGYPANSAPFEWSTDNRMLSPDRRGDFLTNVPTIVNPINGDVILQGHSIGDDRVFPFYGEYNGLDYMLYYNLYTLVNGSAAGAFYNYMDRRITISYPFGLIGTHLNGTTVEGFHTIDAYNIINSNAKVDYRAGEEIHLGNGFHAISNCEFHAYIDPFQCDGGTYRMATNSNDSSNDDGMKNAVAYAGQTTFVSYPAKPKQKDNTSETIYSTPQHTEQTNTTSSNPVIAANKSEISIQPNPTNGSFTVVMKNEERVNAKLTLFNIFGNVIFQQVISNPSAIIDISGEAKGIYYLKVENGQKVSVEKIVFQ